MPDIKYHRPGYFLTNILNPFLVFTGLLPILSVKGRKSGKIIRTPVTPVIYKDHEYLVAPRGQTQWVRNLRAAGKGQLNVSGKTKNFKTDEITGILRDEVIKQYRKKVKAVDYEFKALPDPADHPVFRVA